MNRNERRRTRKINGKGTGSGPRELLMYPDFEMPPQSGCLHVYVPGPVSEIRLLLDGKIQKFDGISYEGKPLASPANELAFAMASSLLQHHSHDPKIPTNVRFSLIHLLEREAFYSQHDLLAGALWMAKANILSNSKVCMHKLQAHVPTYVLLEGVRFMRVRDCLDLLAYASSNADLKRNLMS